jgi:hypothetical protein
MDVPAKINQEKLQSILKPHQEGLQFKITLRFQKFYSKKFEKAYELARENREFYEEGEGEFQRIYASFSRENFTDLHTLYDLVKHRENTRIFINNRTIPYAQDLWLFLAWFYNVK